MEQAKSIPVEILKQFAIDGSLISIEELKRGHINRTYVGTWGVGKQRCRYIHQVVNHRIFEDIPGMMRNLDIVTRTLREKRDAGELREDEQTLTLIKARTGGTFLQDENGEYWRTFEYIEDTVTYDVCPNPTVARESAAILGRFQRSLRDLDPSQFAETIPYFVDGGRRYTVFQEVISKDPCKRSSACAQEIEFALERGDFGGSLISAVRDGVVPARVSHNDMKLNNVLYGPDGKRAICLLDLDTCMSGTALYDFGDLVRNTAVPCAEDEQDFSKVVFDMDLYRAICHGYMAEMGEFLTSSERERLAVAPRNLALILGVRFLTDYLAGDTYFRIHRKNQNLERARTQFQIVRMMERLEEGMQQVVQG
jgi:Ser/Thr protein kinase RdoA (MazF antagonist)